MTSHTQSLAQATLAPTLVVLNQAHSDQRHFIFDIKVSSECKQLVADMFDPFDHAQKRRSRLAMEPEYIEKK